MLILIYVACAIDFDLVGVDLRGARLLEDRGRQHVHVRLVHSQTKPMSQSALVEVVKELHHRGGLAKSQSNRSILRQAGLKKFLKNSWYMIFR